MLELRAVAFTLRRADRVSLDPVMDPRFRHRSRSASEIGVPRQDTSEGSGVVEPNSEAFVAFAFRFGLHDLEAADLSSRGDVGAAVGLLIEYTRT